MSADLSRVIIVDMEFSGMGITDGFISIGAVRLTTDDFFEIRCHLYDYQTFSPDSLKIIGLSQDELYDDSLPNQHTAVSKFYKWCDKYRKSSERLIYSGHNIYGDVKALKSVKPGWPFQSRMLDIHAVAFAHSLRSFSAKELCEHLGVTPEPEIHTALGGALQGKRCLSKLLNLR